MANIDKNINSRVTAAGRRRRDAEAARENILAAAEAILTAEGPQSLKLTAVAGAAAVSNAAVLHHFGSVDGVQRALMERMVRQLVERVLEAFSQAQGSAETAGRAMMALFDAFEARGAARLAAWLELTGEADRFAQLRPAVRAALSALAVQFPMVSADLVEDFSMTCIVLALGVGLFGSTVGGLVDRPAGHARELALGLLLTSLREGLAQAERTGASPRPA